MYFLDYKNSYFVNYQCFVVKQIKYSVFTMLSIGNIPWIKLEHLGLLTVFDNQRKTIVFVSFFDCFQKGSFSFWKKRLFSFGKKGSFLKTTHSFWTLIKQITIVFENDRFFLKTISDHFLYDCFFTKRSLTKGRR